jgi:hypothetical protein
MSYDLFEHRHRFAIWAAARAAQRRLGASVDTLREALEKTGIKDFVRDQVTVQISAEEFAIQHRKWCESIVEFLTNAGVREVYFGRAAKLVGIYLKSMIVIGPHADTMLARVAHPPIDRLLLQELARHSDVPIDARRVFRTANWTTLDQAKYEDLVGLIRSVLPEKVNPFWQLEQYWPVTEESDT